ncbi:putative mediator of RNA polymerase II transcription subunit 30-like [Capsicum annuum]|nr:putative mediator of RNA polymerase II transcription subunit 30-like [Capsicum annuum]
MKENIVGMVKCSKTITNGVGKAKGNKVQLYQQDSLDQEELMKYEDILDWLEEEDKLTEDMILDRKVSRLRIRIDRSINRYICDKYGSQGNKGLYGTNPLEKASIDQWIEAEGQSFNPPSSILVFQLAFAPRMKLKQDENLIRQNEEKLKKVLDVYEKRLGESQYLAGDEFTLADLSHFPNIQYLVNGTDRAELFTSRENMGRWWAEISSRESWKKHMKSVVGVLRGEANELRSKKARLQDNNEMLQAMRNILDQWLIEIKQEQKEL